MLLKRIIKAGVLLKHQGPGRNPTNRIFWVHKNWLGVLSLQSFWKHTDSLKLCLYNVLTII